MHNDVVRSEIHSTDSFGFSEAIFGVSHLLGFSYAPRLKTLSGSGSMLLKAAATLTVPRGRSNLRVILMQSSSNRIGTTFCA
jgi:TnpA family transposase